VVLAALLQSNKLTTTNSNATKNKQKITGKKLAPAQKNTQEEFICNMYKVFNHKNLTVQQNISLEKNYINKKLQNVLEQF